MGDKNSPPPKTVPIWANFVLGGLSGMLAVSIVQPADLVKTRMQLLRPKNKLSSTFDVVKRIIQKEGVLGLYSGFSAALCRQAMYTTGRLGCFNSLLDYYKSRYGTPSFPTKLAIGSTSGGVGAFIGNPTEVALVRMTADGRLPPEQRRNYKNVFNAIARIVREEGALTLFRGIEATVTRAMVVNAAQLGTYAQAREALLKRLGKGITLHFVASMISGFVTTCVSLPVDIVKTRIQNAAQRSSQVKILSNIIKNEGPLALWSGFLPTYMKLGPQTVIVFLILEQLNALYLRTF